MAHKKVKKAAPKPQTQSLFNNPLLIGGMVALLVVVIGLVVYFGFGDDENVATTDEVVQNLESEVELSEPQLIDPVTYNKAFVDTNATHQLIDVRTPEEFSSGHIEGAVNIPVEDLDTRLDEVASNMPVVLYCRSGNRSADAADILDGAGFKNIYDLGGVLDWTGAGFSLHR